jgi:hypothetical protein
MLNLQVWFNSFNFFAAQDLADLYKSSISSPIVSNTLLWIASQQSLQVGKLYVPNPVGIDFWLINFSPLLKSANSDKKANLELITRIVDGMETAAKHPQFNPPSISFSHFLAYIVQVNKKGGDSETKAIAIQIRNFVMSRLVRTELGPDEFKAALTCLSQEASESAACLEVCYSFLNL